MPRVYYHAMAAQLTRLLVFFGGLRVEEGVGRAMFKISNHRVLIAGILASPAAAFFGLITYITLTRGSSDREHDFVFRLTMVTIVMAIPSLQPAPQPRA